MELAHIRVSSYGACRELSAEVAFETVDLCDKAQTCRARGPWLRCRWCGARLLQPTGGHRKRRDVPLVHRRRLRQWIGQADDVVGAIELAHQVRVLGGVASRPEERPIQAGPLDGLLDRAVQEGTGWSASGSSTDTDESRTTCRIPAAMAVETTFSMS
jgi:hypothetical protein